ncbi:MAG TPA: hypothetical protein VGP18_01795 [Solirubrobacteraceae bacterium]|nr:hypothetical protein [Solirubrobacteraceae bacterium]
MSMRHQAVLELQAAEQRSRHRMQWVLLVVVLTGSLANAVVTVVHGSVAVGAGGSGWLVPLTLLVRRLFPQTAVNRQVAAASNRKPQ